MQSLQIGALAVVGVICLALGVAAGYGLYSGKGATQTVASTVVQTVTSTSVESINVTVTPHCCTDANLSLSTPCSTILTQNYPPVQQLQYLIETDPTFIAAEDGLNYVANGGLGCGFAINPGTFNGTTVDFIFTHYADSLYTDNCGYVGNITYFLTVKVPLTETGYNISAIQISSRNSSEITVTCTSSIITSTENATTTITQRATST